MKVYFGTAISDAEGRRTRQHVFVVNYDGTVSRLNPRMDLDPYGKIYAWGYNGTGPRRLALALTADLLQDDEAALRMYRRILDRVVSKWDWNSIRAWCISDEELRAACRNEQVLGNHCYALHPQACNDRRGCERSGDKIYRIDVIEPHTCQSISILNQKEY